MSKRDVPKLNRYNFPAWKILMKLHLGGLGDHVQFTITTKHVILARALSTKDMKKKKEHNLTMLEISSALSYAEFDDIRGFDSTNKM
jgi:hypothetical protein